MLHSRHPSRRFVAVPFLLIASCLLVACSSDASTRPTSPTTAVVRTAVVSTASGAPATTTQATTTQATTTQATTAATQVVVTAPAVPSGVTLRIGDQLDYLKSVLSLSGQDQNFPYAIEYGAFVGGPPMLQAFQGNALDAGFIGTTPLIFAQAAGQGLVAIAGWATSEHSSYSLVTAPGTTDIKGWADLKGKTVAYQRGTAGEAVLLQALDSVGLKASDITPVDVSQVLVNSTLEGGSADASIQVEPLTSAYLAADPTATNVVKAVQLTDRSALFISTTAALADPGKSAALADYATRIVRAFAYLRDHPDQVAMGVYVKTYGLTPARAAALVAENGATSFFAVPGDLLAPQQRLADLLVAAGEIPNKIDVSGEFDPRFNDLILATQSSHKP